jgi:hypothetical protein
LASFNDHEAVCGFEKKEGRLSACKAHFFGVLFIIAPNTVNAVNRKALRYAQHGYRNRRRRWKHKAHDVLSKKWTFDVNTIF